MSPVPLATNRLRVSRCWLFALTLAALAPLCSAQDPTPAPAGPEGRFQADDAIRYRVDIVAPGDVASSLRSAVDLIRWQDYEDMTEDLFDRLTRDAVPQAKEAAATQGFFSAEIDIRVDRTAKPARVELVVKTGKPTVVQSVAIDVTGPANDSPEGRQQNRRIEIVLHRQGTN